MAHYKAVHEDKLLREVRLCMQLRDVCRTTRNIYVHLTKDSKWYYSIQNNDVKPWVDSEFVFACERDHGMIRVTAVNRFQTGTQVPPATGKTAVI